jgi:hypothetical protein
MRSFWLSRSTRRPTRSTPRARAGRLRLESLEDRLAPATLTVNSSADTANATDPYLSLREAIALFNAPSLPAGLSDQILEQINGTLHGGGTDTIVFDPGAVSSPILLDGSQLELSLPGSMASLTIDGGAGATTVDANHTSRVLVVDAGVQATLDHLTLTHGWTTTGLLYGGGIDNRGTMTVSDSVITANSAGFNGGGINNQGTMTVSNCVITSNSATVQISGAGGGILNGAGTLTLSNSTISSNFSSEDGGGIDDATGTMMVSDCTISSNSALNDGGGINNDRGTTTVNNCTLTANSALLGGAVFNYSATLTLNHSTLIANQASYGGGIGEQFVNTLTLQNTIVASNSSDILGGTASASSSYNLIGTGGSGGLVDGANHNLVGVANPGLAPLGDYGGPTRTMPPLPGSPALDAGDNTVPPGTDQRGLPRVVGGQSDIGAFQTQADPVLVTTLADPGRLSGQLSLREAVNLADALPGDNTVSFDPALGAGTVTLTAGQLELSGAPGVRTIDGGNRITVDANHDSRLFLVDAGVQAVLTRLSLGNGNSDAGAAVFNSGTLTLANSTLFGNVAIFGGAVYNAGTLTLSGSTLEFDFASYQGGGLYNAGQLTAFNSTFVYDTAFANGGAVYTAAGTDMLTSLTISRNAAASGGGLAVAGGTVLLRNSIVARNQNDPGSSTSDVAGTLSAGSSYNLIGTGGSGGLSDGVNHNHVGVADPGLTTPDFSSTLTPVFGFTSTSPALGAGDPTLLSDPLLRLDQHGNLRNNPPNIGAL